MKQFNLQGFETHPDGSVILYGRDNRHIRLRRMERGTRVETVTSHTGTYFWGDEAMADPSTVHGADISDILFAPPGKQPGEHVTLI